MNKRQCNLAASSVVKYLAPLRTKYAQEYPQCNPEHITYGYATRTLHNRDDLQAQGYSIIETLCHLKSREKLTLPTVVVYLIS